MAQASEVFIVSAFGRGHWLAAHLQKNGIPTTLLDVTPQLGQWPYEVFEGPYGLFKSDIMDESKLAVMHSGDLWQEQVDGFSLWCEDSVFDFKSPLIEHKLKQSQFGKIQAAVSQYHSTVYASNLESLAGRGFLTSLSSSYFIRKLTQRGYDQSLDFLQEAGVSILRKSEIVDFSFSKKKQISGAELRGEQPGIFKFQQLVWCLSSEETFFLNEKLAKALFKEKAESMWCWLRYRLQIGASEERSVLPLSTLLIQDIDAPWTHENMMVLQVTPAEDQFDVWLRLPTVQRFNKDYLSSRGIEVESALAKRLPLSEIKIMTYPQEYYYTYAQLGAPTFPVFEFNPKIHINLENLNHLGVESLQNFGWEYLLRSEHGVFEKLHRWWSLKLQQEAKKKGSDLKGEL